MLFFLIDKADIVNERKLLKGFPAETIIYLLWYNSKTEDEFYKTWGDIEDGNKAE